MTDIKLNGTSIPAGGTMTLMVGNTYTIELDGFTATQGYNQLESFINFPNTIFQVESVSTSYSSDTAAASCLVPPFYPCVSNPNDDLYADACGWDNDPGSPNYRSCVGGDYKAGGTVDTIYTVKIIGGAGTSDTLNTLLYDFSGSSFHYNSDYSAAERIFSIFSTASVTIQKSFSPKAIAPVGTSSMIFTLTNPTVESVTGVNFTDTLAGITATDGTANDLCGAGNGTLVIATTGGVQSLGVSGATLAPNSTCTV